MAAAILMMNMQGVVLAADKDSTIFRYSDDIPFAIMADPCSNLPWSDIWEEFRASNPYTGTMSFYERVESITLFLTSYLQRIYPNIPDDELMSKTICVGYDSDMFPKASFLEISQSDENIVMKNSKDVIISRDRYVFLQAIGECTNINILLGGVSDRIMRALYADINTQLASILGAPVELVENDSRVVDVYLNLIDDIQKDPQTKEALRYFTIKDMVAMEENLIDTENLKQSSSTTLGGSYTREIGTLTLAEGFKWIKHSLYGV